MDRKKRARPRVFVVQSQLLRDGMPKYDLTPAEDYGELVYLLDSTASQHRPHAVRNALVERLQSFTERDYLLPIGNPLFIGMASIVAAEFSPSIKFLLWSGRDNQYMPVEVELDDETDTTENADG
ncbi:MAG: hypothetical protein ACXWWG_00650 [Nitrospira sp.]